MATTLSSPLRQLDLTFDYDEHDIAAPVRETLEGCATAIEELHATSRRASAASALAVAGVGQEFSPCRLAHV